MQKKELTKLDVMSVAFGAIIGWGCFVLPGNTFLPKAGPLGTAIGITLGAIFVMLISQSYGYLIQKLPGSGGEFFYINAAFGSTHAFVGAWFLILAYTMIIPLNATAVGLLVRYFLPDLASLGYLYTVSGWDIYAGELIPAILALAFVAFINIRGVKGAGWMQTALAILLFSTVMLTTVLCLSSAQADISNLTPVFLSENSSDWSGEILSIVAVSAWAFMGFDCIPQMSDEYNFPHRQSKVLMYLAIALAALMYISINTITALAEPWQDLVGRTPDWATGEAVSQLMGTLGLSIIAIAMICAVVSGLNGFYMSSTRLVRVLALERALPKRFSKTHEKHDTPVYAIYFVTAISLVAILFGRMILSLIVDMTSVGTSLVFLYSTASAAKLAWQEGNTKQVIWSMIGICASSFLLILLVIPTMPGYIGDNALWILLLWVILGVGFYIANRKNYNDYAEKRKKEGNCNEGT